MLNSPPGPAHDQAALANRRLAWFEEAKFGLFVHWVPYSVAGVEVSWPVMAPDLSAILYPASPSIDEADYVALPRSLNPADYDPDAWVRLARRAGRGARSGGHGGRERVAMRSWTGCPLHFSLPASVRQGLRNRPTFSISTSTTSPSLR